MQYLQLQDCIHGLLTALDFLLLLLDFGGGASGLRGRSRALNFGPRARLLARLLRLVYDLRGDKLRLVTIVLGQWAGIRADLRAQSAVRKRDSEYWGRNHTPLTFARR